MKKEELVELSKKLGMNQEAVEYHFTTNPKFAEKQILDAAEFMGLVPKEDKKKKP